MVEFFGTIDKKRDPQTGEMRISSEYPAYTFPQQIESLKEDLAQKKRLLETGSVDRGSEGEYRILIEREEKQLEGIEKSRPKLSDVEKDMCATAYKDLTKGISGNMPTREDIHRNFFDAHEEHRRNTNPCIKVNAKTAELADRNGIKVSSNCEMSRKDASKLAKIIGHVIGENTNMERLRKDGSHGGGSRRR